MDEANRATDPRGWLTQQPELERFASDPSVAAAVASGDARRLHQALQARRRKPRSPGEVAALDRILGNRRNFAMPVAKAPRLFTLNGIGQRIYGKSEARPDGSYIGTLFGTFVYIPVWPVAQYLLARNGRQYVFFGQVPLSRVMRLWRRGVGALALAALLATAASGWWSGRYANVQLLNGLDIPVAVIAGGESADLAPGARATRRLPVGRTVFQAKAADGRMIEEVTGDVPSRISLVAYSVAGAAPLVVEPVVYQRDRATGASRPPALAFFGSRQFVSRGSVDYLFSEAPKRIEMRSKDKETIRWRAFLPDGRWHTTVDYLRSNGRAADASEVAARVAAAQPGDVSALSLAARLAGSLRGPDAALEVARRGAAAAPDSIEIQRILSAAFLAAGRRAEAISFFRERQAREPGSAAAAYLRARVERHEEGLRLLREYAGRFPSDPWIQRSLGWHLVASHRDAEGLAALETAARLDPKGARDLAEVRAVALVRQGRAAEAARRLLDTAGDRPTIGEAVLYAQLARLAGTEAPKPASHLLDALPTAPPVQTYARAQAAAVLGDPQPDEAAISKIEDAPAAAAARLYAAARSDPARAVQLAADASDEALGNVLGDLALLLAGEALRRGNEVLALRILQQGPWTDVAPKAVLAFLRSSEPVELDEIDPGLRAALHVGRARAAATAGRSTVADERAARELDVLHGAPTNALDHWPKP